MARSVSKLLSKVTAPKWSDGVATPPSNDPQELSALSHACVPTLSMRTREPCTVVSDQQFWTGGTERICFGCLQITWRTSSGFQVFEGSGVTMFLVPGVRAIGADQASQ